MLKRYYIYDDIQPEGPVRGDVLVWEGEVWNETAGKSANPILITRYLYEYDGFYFLTPREDLIEFVPARELENPDDSHRLPPGYRKIWNTPYHV